MTAKAMKPNTAFALLLHLVLGSVLMTATCDAASTSTTVAPPQRLVVVSNGEVVGTLVATRTDNKVTVAYAVNDNGRGPKANETIELDKRGFPLHWQITGESLFGAAVDEVYDWKDGVASWRSQADHGSVAASQPGMYIGGDSSPWALQMYAQATLRAPGHSLPVLPSGNIKLEALDTLTVGEPAVPVTIYKLSGIQLEPQLLALDTNQRLFARFGNSGGLIREGYEAALPQLGEWARAYELRHLKELQATLAHHWDRPVRYRNVHIFDSVSQKTTAPVSVVVANGRITAIEAADAVGQAGSEVLVDGQGGTLVPGLADMHSHSTMVSGLFYLAVGVTSTRDMGNDNALLPKIQSAIKAGELAGPRITPNGLIEGRSPYSIRLGIVADSLDEALDAVHWYAQHGYFEIKTYSSVKPEWVVPLATEAHKLGLGVTGHVPAFVSPDDVIRAGYNSIAHINQLMLGWLLEPGEDSRTPLRLTAMKRAATLNLDDPRVQKTVQLMREHGTSLDTTAVILERLMLSRAGEVNPGDVPYLSHMPIGYQRYRKRTFVPLKEATDDAQYRAAFDTLLRVIKLLYDNDIRMLPGTDDTTGFTLQRELELYVKAGVPASATLAMATLGAEDYLRQDKELGSIVPGKDADFFLIPGDPVENISAIRQVKLVSRGGVIYFPAEIYRALDIEPFATPAEVVVPSAVQ